MEKTALRGSILGGIQQQQIAQSLRMQVDLLGSHWLTAFNAGKCDRMSQQLTLQHLIDILKEVWQLGRLAVCNAHGIPSEYLFQVPDSLLGKRFI